MSLLRGPKLPRRCVSPTRPTRRRPPPLRMPRLRVRMPPPPQRRRGRPAKRRTASFSGRSTSSAPPASSEPSSTPSEQLTLPGKADFVLMLKGARRLLLLRGSRVLRDYTVALGPNPKGPKRRNGDGRTPEGRYWLDWRIEESRFHRAIHVSYPNERDREVARGSGVPPG